MGELDSKTWIETARTLACLRQSLWRWLVCFLVVVVLGATTEALKDNPNQYGSISDPLTIGWGCAFVAVWARAAVAMIRLLAFHCPRCGKWFAVSWYTWPTNHCKHCDLDLSRLAMANAKPLAQEDLLE
jgi:hypothetical protein